MKKSSFPTAPFEVVIPSRNRINVVQEALSSLEAAANRASLFLKVKVVDDGSTIPYRLDDTCYHHLDLHVIRLNKCKGAGGARNAGISQTSSNWIAFIDDDCIVDEHWLIRAINKIQHNETPSPAVIGGNIIPGKCNGC